MMLRLRRVAALIVIGGYLLAIGWYSFRHLLGDSASDRLAYFWTWDMFPGFPAVSVRRSAIAERGDGTYVRLVPDAWSCFRWGVGGDVTRFDLDRRDEHLRGAAERALRRHAAAGVRFRAAYLIERSWPARFNLPDDLYRAEHGEANPRRHSYRVIDEAAVDSGGGAAWASAR